MSKHTTGPWRMKRDGVDTRTNKPLYDIWSSDASKNGIEQTVAQCVFREDARLIAAAPDLLEACRKALTCASIPDAVMEIIRAAILRATDCAADTQRGGKP